MPPELPETIGPFQVRELLGRAGQSAVYTASSPAGREVAIKLFPAALSASPATVEHFHREMRTWCTSWTPGRRGSASIW